MLRPVHLIALLGILLAGCSSGPRPISGDRVTIFVPGVAGNQPFYGGLIKVLEKSGRSVEVYEWGSPMMSLNFSDPETHAIAERDLANRLVMIPDQVRQIDLVAHSAGCGVVLGALRYTNRPVGRVMLLSPSVSPGYDLTRPLQKSKIIYSFYSELDQTFLKWRTSNFGTYDRIKTPAAGHLGFAADSYPSELQKKLLQYPYDPAWKNLGNDGGHTGTVAEHFFQTVASPLLRD